MSAGNYIYIDLRAFASEDGKAHTLRFNVETGEMEDLTEKTNNGSIYRVNHDGTGLVCIYEEADFEITGRVAVITGNQFLVEGRNVRVRDNQVETWDKGVLVGTIGADGKIDELKPVEVVE